jgi:hypothetical protein
MNVIWDQSEPRAAATTSAEGLLRGDAAVDDEPRAGHEGCVVRGEEHERGEFTFVGADRLNSVVSEKPRPLLSLPKQAAHPPVVNTRFSDRV